ncbi:hypothetical protein VNO80_09400 [Phaseolus coccineus]|uniref:Uncharacterized protein n=1 Tax=Phaseolus coccineus TaxID=3886 RepID=A0AAN9NCH4_PHACN
MNLPTLEFVSFWDELSVAPFFGVQICHMVLSRGLSESRITEIFCHLYVVPVIFLFLRLHDSEDKKLRFSTRVSKRIEHEVQLFPLGTTIRTRIKDKWNMRNMIKVTRQWL